jgi:DNA-binding NarL/FixJ family response regulator
VLIAHILQDIAPRKQREALTAQLVQAAQQLAAAQSVETSLPPIFPLTAREIAALRLIAEGRSDSVVANELHISLGTLRNHLSHV